MRFAAEFRTATGVHDDLPTMVKKRKPRCYDHISRSSGNAKTILHGTAKGARRRGRDGNLTSWIETGFGDSMRVVEDSDTVMILSFRTS